MYAVTFAAARTSGPCSGATPGSPAPNCSSAAFEFGSTTEGVVLCSGYIKPCPAPATSHAPISSLLPVHTKAGVDPCTVCPEGYERVGGAENRLCSAILY